MKRLSRELYPAMTPGSGLRIFGGDTVKLRQRRGRIGRVPAADMELSGFFGDAQLAHDLARDQRTVEHRS